MKNIKGQGMTDSQPEAMRQNLRALLGGFSPTGWRVASVAPHEVELAGVRVLALSLVDGAGQQTRAYLTGPMGEWHTLPAVLHCHAHGGRYDIGADEVLTGRPALQQPVYAQAYAAAGYVSLTIDLPCFGVRAGATESATAKRYLWQGQTLFGAMLADLSGALTLLAQWPGVDGQRIGAFGISMGATLAFWLGALDSRLKAIAQLCCFADLATLIAQNGHDRHGHYMTVPGLVPVIGTGGIAGLCAPVPQLACLGLRDALTPPEAIDIAVAEAQAAYAAAGAAEAFSVLVDPETGHMETPEMRAAVFNFFARHL